MWPRLTNIEPKIFNKIIKRDVVEASQRVSWIRVFSGANNGMILTSTTGFNIFSAAGQKSASVYGNSETSGTVGKDWNGGNIETTAGKILRPSPLVDSFEVKEGKDQISREGTLKIKCFSLEQMEIIQTYFMEPGYTLCIEYGWNTPDAATQLISAGKNVASTLKDCIDRNLDYTKLHEARVASKGDYDSFLAFIVGGNISAEGEIFSVEVKLRGAPGLPTFLQSQHKTQIQDPVTKLTTDTNGPKPYQTTELNQEGEDFATVRDRRFKQMFNLLPASRQTDDVKKLMTKCSWHDFINFDVVVNKTIGSYTDPGFWSSLFGDGKEVAVGAAAIEKEKLFSKNRYLRFELIVKILNENGAFSGYKMGGPNGKDLSVKINIDDVKIGAFPKIFSTKPSKLIITGDLPDFSIYFLNTTDVEQKANGVLSTQGIDYPPVSNEIKTNGETNGISFVQNSPLNLDGFTEKAGHWGYLKNLYLNFDVFINKIGQPNKTIREVFLDILNEMSSAVNSYWNFQIAENQAKVDGKDGIIITVYDENWVGSNPNSVSAVFHHAGSVSRFIEANLELSLPSEMTNQIVSRRLALVTNPDEAIVGIGGFFESKGDLFLNSVILNNGTTRTIQTEEQAAASAPKQKTTEQTEADKKAEEYDKIKRQNETDKAANGGEVPPDDAAKEAKAKEEKDKADKAAADAALSQNLNKIDVVPDATLASMADVSTSDIKNHDTFRNSFRVYTFDDNAYFDKMKNDSFTSGKTGTLSHPLPIKYSFKILGTSGIRRGDMFNIDGIPSKYTKNGLFQVTQVDQSLEDTKWITSIMGEYRQIN